MQGWLSDLLQATKSGALSCLSHLNLIHCNGVEGKLSMLFLSLWPELRYVNLLETFLNATDLEFLCTACNGHEKRLPKLTSLCLFLSNELELNTIGTKLFRIPWVQLRELCLEYDSNDTHIHAELNNALNENSLPNVESLIINGRFAGETFKKGSLNYSELVIFENIEIFDDNSFPILKTIYYEGDYYSKDEFATNLVQANRNGQLPELKNLRIPAHTPLEVFFDEGCSWNNLLSLNTLYELDGVYDNYEYQRKWTKDFIECLNNVVRNGCLSSLQELGIWRFHVNNTRWPQLRKLYLEDWEEADQKNIADAVDQGLLPCLRTVCPYYFNPEVNSLCRLSEKGVSFHQRIIPRDDPFTKFICICQKESSHNMSVYLDTARIRSMEMEHDEN